MRRSLRVRLALLSCVVIRPAAYAAAQRTPAEPAPVHDARAAQRNFEFTRRVRLPLTDYRSDASRNAYYGDGCPVRIGRLCWWDNDDEGAPPPEPASITAARTRLLDVLARAAAADPTNDWITGQRVRYALEARRPDSALAVAVACTGTPTWCLGLRGVVLHLANRAADAAAAFDSADALRTPAERCAWYDVSPWLESGPAHAYHRLACGTPERARWEARFWRLAQPLWMLPVNDLRNEWSARRVMARIHADGANPYGMNWGDDLAECELRYGWPTGWSTRESATSSMYVFSGDAGRSVVGHEPAPSYDFVPHRGALDGGRAGADVPDDAWTLRPSPDATPTEMRYAPAYAGGGIGTPTHQLARFRHGDTSVVVGAYDATRDSLWSEGSTPPTLSAALVVLDDSGHAAAAQRRDSVGRTGALVAQLPVAQLSVGTSRTGQSLPHQLLGLEILQRDTVHTSDGRRVLGRALRIRTPWRPLASDAPLSDLLLLRHSPGPTPAFADAVDSAAGTQAVRRGAAMGLYWEQYVAPVTTPSSAATPATPDTIVIAATRLTRSLPQRLAALLGRGTVERPIALRFADPGGPAPGRAIGLTWPDVPAGDYRLDVTLVPGTPGRQPATSALVVHITED
ncbi:hypothetical protein tb265_13600 [Gemmatimonadetes bacterium T265]|nr:hypothetical protein tb265_13600 [Gemmatimonadetes bacterium T265]